MSPTPTHKPPVYDRLAARYDRAFEPLEKWFLAGLRRAALNNLPREGYVLEVGAGTGLNFPYYPAGARGVATELSSSMINIADTKARPPGVYLVRNSAEQLPFDDDTFDAALATLVFCSVASPLEAFTELRRVVRPGGTIVLLEHVRPGGLLGYVFDALSVLTVALFDDHFNRRTADAARHARLHVTSIKRRFFGVVQIIVCRA
ncbi:MAG TPA: class I SAM-dependent methyltransferase [Pyrinomonadaceae bacterium]|nr:class I SAM-dependent methyltransferase [Pyrinomonadaceae bacterium]